MSRNILYNTQLSMYDKQTGLLTPEADGNINMLRNTINEWHRNFPNDKFVILLPNAKEVVGYDFGLNNNNNITYLFYDNYAISARVNRYNFSVNELSSILKKINIKFDLLINDVIEITGNFKQMFNINFGYTPKIISNIRHTDESNNSSYIYRVIDGITHSDMVTILSESMIPKLVTQIFNAGINGKHISYLLDKHKLIVFEPSISYLSLNNYYDTKKENEKTIITFPGRLSFGEEERTNWDKFLYALKELRKTRSDFEVYFTDPNNNLDKVYPIHNEVDWIHTIPRDREMFLELLNKTNIIVSLMSVEGFGGISIREALMFDCLPVIPYVDEYKKMAPKEYDGFVSTPIDVEDLANALEWAIVSSELNIYKSSFNAIQFSIEEQFKKLIPFIGGVKCE